MRVLETFAKFFKLNLTRLVVICALQHQLHIGVVETLSSQILAQLRFIDGAVPIFIYYVKKRTGFIGIAADAVLPQHARQENLQILLALFHHLKPEKPQLRRLVQKRCQHKQHLVCDTAFLLS